MTDAAVTNPVSEPGSNPPAVGVNTRVIHHGESFAGETGSVMPPIFPSSTFAHGNPGGFDSVSYTHLTLPTILLV